MSYTAHQNIELLRTRIKSISDDEFSVKCVSSFISCSKLLFLIESLILLFPLVLMLKLKSPVITGVICTVNTFA